MVGATAEQAMVGRWAWQSFGVVLREAPPDWPATVDAVTIRDGEPGVTARIVYRADAPHWRAAIMQELAVLIDAFAA